MASLNDLLSRVKIKSSVKQSNDFWRTIADVGARSMQYLSKEWPFAAPHKNDSTRSSANTDLEIESPAGQFRQAGRVLPIQRKVLHWKWLASDR